MYSPEVEIVPTFGVRDQVTVVLVVPVTVAVNCRVWDADSDAVVGDTVTVMPGGFSVIVAVPLFVVSAALVALAVTV